MGRAALSSQTCTIARAAALVGDEWTLMILREMFLGSRRFDDFLRQTRMSSHLLSQRLKKLEAAGIVKRKAYSDHPPRYEYGLTEMGRALWPVVISLKQWGDRWLGDGEMPVALVHKGCGAAVEPRMTCLQCGEPMDAHASEARLSTAFAAERRNA
ncbi:MAG: winged helix-turn-helix transcriptional regulator [Hyphomicrobiaceae bacterium]